MKPNHPGRVLKREMEARHLSAGQLALAIHVSPTRIRQICKGDRGISAETALRLSTYFGNSPRFWMNLQTGYELACAEAAIGPRIRTEVAHAAQMPA